MSLLKEGNQRRTQEATAANMTSSRSHAILEVRVVRSSGAQDTVHRIRTSKLFMIDLAGSERAARTKNTGDRMVEGAHINLSLLALGNCINSLSSGARQRYVNFRDSKLTRMLKDSLDGNCRTVMIACCSPADLHYEETYNTMNYANRAKNIKNTTVVNEEHVEAHIMEYRTMITDLRQQVAVLKARSGQPGNSNEELSPGAQVGLPAARSSDQHLLQEAHLLLQRKTAVLLKLQKELAEMDARQHRLDSNFDQCEAEVLATERLGQGLPSTQQLRAARLKHKRDRAALHRRQAQHLFRSETAELGELPQKFPRLATTEPAGQALKAMTRAAQLEVENAGLEGQVSVQRQTLREHEKLLDEASRRLELSGRIVVQQSDILAANDIIPTGELKAILAEHATLPPLALPARKTRPRGMSEGALFSMARALSDTYTKIAPRLEAARRVARATTSIELDVNALSPADEDKEDCDDDQPMPDDWAISPEPSSFIEDATPLLSRAPEHPVRHTATVGSGD